MKIVMNDGEERDVADARALDLVNSGAAKAADPNAVVEVPSPLVSEAEARQAYAETEYATPQEKKQAAIERQDLERGTHARLHQTDLPSLAVADEQHAKAVELDADEMYRNKGPVEARPDSAGYAGVPDGKLAEPVSATSGPAKDVPVNVPDVPDVKAAAAKADTKATVDTSTEDTAVTARPVKAVPAKDTK